MTKLDDRIETLQERLQQLKVRQQRAKARETALASRRARKDDTRRKILVGAILLAKVEQGAELRLSRSWHAARRVKPVVQSGLLRILGLNRPRSGGDWIRR